MPEGTQNFFVDEAGDLTLFGRRGRSLIGTEGVSTCFMVGVAALANPVQVADELDALRKELLNDSYLKDIPSMTLQEKKTAVCFHAKDDCPEVRERVFKLLREHEVKVQVGIRRKKVLADEVRFRLARGVRVSPNDVYDDIVKSIFKRSLHKSDENVIYFAKRGKSDRQQSLEKAIRRAQMNFMRDYGITSDKPTKVLAAYPSQVACLQVIDYFLWALQRLCERGDDRYFNYLREKYRLIMDFDDKRTGKPYGRWYNDSDPLSKEKWLPPTG